MLHYGRWYRDKHRAPTLPAALDLPGERWLPVVGHEDAYEVSDLGRTRSLSRTIMRSDGRPQALRGQLLKGTPNTSGHLQVSLSGRKDRPIHTLVMEAFVGPRPEGLEVRHLDGEHRNNQLSNLAYGTHLENMQDGSRHGCWRREPRQVCSLGHRLVAPNLTNQRPTPGCRQCSACQRARHGERRARSNGRPFDFKAAADQHYSKIMSAA